MRHLTLTGNGSNASRMLCQAPPREGDTYWHWMYCSPEDLAQPEICPACKAILDDDNDAA